ncbi:MAG TPA: hypothetical protein VGN46_10370 [Luteibacter sp.]|jgi:hypothetical protein|uniref:hypothetical protein n=1 Tax=Luteibacter sp. TaxID=1886636 RepID=UPI002F420FAE
MTSRKRTARPVGRASLYATQHPLLFLALTPAIVCILIALVPAALLGLLIILPGLSGIAGLIGITMAWLGLAAPGLIERRGGTIVFLLAASMPAILYGLSILLIDTRGVPNHAVDPMMAAGPASMAFAVLAVFFVAGVIAWDSEAATAHAAYARRWKILGILVVLLTLPLPVGGLLMAGGFGNTIRQVQGAQAEALSQRAMLAADAYRSAHGGAFPVDNLSAGLPAPAEMHDTYVASVTLANGEIRLVYRDNAMARAFGAGADDVSLVFRSVAGGGSGWSCLMNGYRLENDLPLGIHGRCRSG